MMKLHSNADRWFVVLAACFGIVTTILLGQLELVRLSYVRLNDYRDSLLSHSIDVAQSGRDALATINASSSNVCSDDNLTELRLLAFKAHYLSDVGRTKDNHILCSALWGRLAPPVVLPKWEREVDGGHKLWADATGIGKHINSVDMVSHDTGIVFTSPVAFALHEPQEPNLSAYVVNKNGDYIYRSFGNVSELTTQMPRKLAWYDLRSRRIVSRCSEKLDICVIASLSGVSILQQSGGILLALAGFGAFAGGGLGIAAIRWRRGYSSLPQQIKRAILEKRIDVVYQPLVLLRSERLVGAEVLARLSDDHGVAISPDVFITIAEQQGVIKSLTRVVVRKALEEMKPRLQDRKDFYLSLNVTVDDLLDPSTLSFFDQELERLELSSSQIVLEITERSTAQHERLIESMKLFRARGYQFLIDDFGTGYSNLAYLAKLPINGIKIDRMFTQAIGTEAVSAEIVGNICSMAARLNLRLVAEGIETQQQANYVRSLHPDAVGQGWLYGHPVPIWAFNEEHPAIIS